MMGIMSKEETVGALNFSSLAVGRVLKCKRVMNTGKGVVIELENGKYAVCRTAHTDLGKWAVQGYGLEDFSKTVLDGFVRLGVLTRDVVKSHKSSEKETRAARERRQAEQRLAKLCRELGVDNPLKPTVK